MRNTITVLAAAAVLGLTGIGAAHAQGSAQCNLYPQSPGCPQYIPGQGWERNPRVGPTYPHEAPRYYRYDQAPGYYYQKPPKQRPRDYWWIR